MSVLTRPTLKLNKNWTALDVVPLADAIADVSKEAASVLHDFTPYTWEEWRYLHEPQDGDAVIHLPRGEVVAAPEIILLHTYDHVPKERGVRFSRRNLAKRDNFTCQYCGQMPPRDELSMDHVTPRVQGGISVWTNVVLACLKCNNRKAGRTPEQAGMRLLKQPHRPKWKPEYANAGYRPRSWEAFISKMHWEVPLQP